MGEACKIITGSDTAENASEENFMLRKESSRNEGARKELKDLFTVPSSAGFLVVQEREGSLGRTERHER